MTKQAQKQNGKSSEGRNHEVPEEYQRSLVRQYQENGDSDALDRLLRIHAAFCRRVARDYADKDEMVSFTEDLEQQARLGLVVAAVMFDLKRKNVKFLSYAGFWAYKYAREFFNLNKTAIARPVNVNEKDQKILKEHEKLSDLRHLRRGHLPMGDAELDALERKLGHRIHQIEEIQALYYAAPLSINAPVNSDDDDSPSHLDMQEGYGASPYDRAACASDLKYLRRVFNEAPLDSREREIIRRRYLTEKFDVPEKKAVGKKMGMSGEHLGTLEAAALRKMLAYSILLEEEAARNLQSIGCPAVAASAAADPEPVIA